MSVSKYYRIHASSSNVMLRSFFRVVFFFVQMIQGTRMPSYESRISLSKMLIEVEEFDVSIT